MPDRSEFYSSLKDECISEKDWYIYEKVGCISEKDEHINEDDYLHDVTVWNEFKMNSLGDYYDLHLNLLLTDVFEKLINWSLKDY